MNWLAFLQISLLKITMSNDTDFTEDEIVAAVKDVLDRSSYKEEGKVADIKKVMRLVLTNSISIQSASVLHNLPMKELESLVDNARRCMSSDMSRAISKNLPELNEEEICSTSCRKSNQDLECEEVNSQLPSPNKADNSLTSDIKISKGAAKVPEYWKGYPLVINGAIRDALISSKVSHTKRESMFKAIRQVIMKDSSVKSVMHEYDVTSSVHTYYHKARERLVDVLGEMAVPMESKDFLLTAETSYTSLRNHVTKYRTIEHEDTPTTSHKRKRHFTNNVLPTRALSSSPSASSKPPVFVEPAVPSKRDSSCKNVKAKNLVPAASITPKPTSRQQSMLASKPPLLVAPEEPDILAKRVRTYTEQPPLLANNYGISLRSQQNTVLWPSDRNPKATKQRDILRWLHTSSMSYKPTKENMVKGDEEEKEILDKLPKKTRASTGDATLNTSVAKNTRSRSSGDKLTQSMNCSLHHPSVTLSPVAKNKSALNNITLGINKKQQKKLALQVFSGITPIVAVTVTPAKNSRKSVVPVHWSQYPQVVRGVIEEVMNSCKDQNLRTKISKGVVQVVDGAVSIDEAVKMFDCSPTTLRKYINISKNKLAEVLGGDLGLSPNLERYVSPSTTYSQLLHLIRNGPHVNGLEIEETEDQVEDIEELKEDAGISVLTNQSPTTPVQLPHVEWKEKSTVEISATPILKAIEQGECSSKALVRQELQPVDGVLVNRKRRHFCGTADQLRELLTKVLKKRYSGNLEKMVNVLTENIVKDQKMKESLKRNDITLEHLLAAYNFVGRFVSMERLVVREKDENEPMIEEEGEEEELFPIADLALLLPSKLNEVDQLCVSLVNAFGSTRDACLQRTSMVNYMVGVSYKRNAVDKRNMTKCVQVMFVDSVSVNCAVQDHPSVKSHALDYLDRCREARQFFCANFRKLTEAIVKTCTDEEEGERPHKRQKMMEDMGDGTSSVPDYLDDNCLIALLNFLGPLKQMNFPILRNLVVWLVKYIINAKGSDLLEKFEWTQTMDDWLEQQKLVSKDLSSAL